jgi:hypothetical protein
MPLTLEQMRLPGDNFAGYGDPLNLPSAKAVDRIIKSSPVAKKGLVRRASKAASAIKSKSAPVRKTARKAK